MAPPQQRDGCLHSPCVRGEAGGPAQQHADRNREPAAREAQLPHALEQGSPKTLKRLTVRAHSGDAKLPKRKPLPALAPARSAANKCGKGPHGQVEPLQQPHPQGNVLVARHPWVHAQGPRTLQNGVVQGRQGSDAPLQGRPS